MSRARAVAVRVVSLALAAVAAAWALSVFTPVFVGGGSMSPTLVPGDLVFVRRGTATVRSGAVVLVDKPGWPEGVLHRVVDVTFDDHLVLRGDANPIPDLSPTPIEDVRGVVVLVVYSGRLLGLVERALRMVQSRVT